MSRRARGWTIAIAAIAIVAAVLVVVWEQRDTTKEAIAKATELKAKATELGFTTPPVDVLAAIYGDDGGALVATADSDLWRSLAVSGIGRQGEVNGRPVIVDERVLAWHYLVLSVYAPDKAEEFKKYLEDLSTDDVVEE
jgi:hypothetical protein